MFVHVPNCCDSLVSFNSGVKKYALGDPLFQQEMGTDENQSLYCYDDVTYDYSSVVTHLGGEKSQNFIIPKDGTSSPKIKATVIRQCYSSNQPSLDLNYYEKIKRDYSNPITVYAYGNNYSFYPDFSNDDVISSRYEGRVTSTYSFEYKLKNPISYGGVSSGQAYIDFSNYSQMFGASNKFISEMLKHDKSECENKKFKKSSTNCYGSYGLTFNNLSLSGNDGKCGFSYNIKGTKKNADPNLFYKFRVISLENPFPGKDGSSRMPAKNWFYNENYVYDYIVNNRGIKSVMNDVNASPEQMYFNVEPMYSITLTPSTMLEIRKYNKKFSYYSMYDASSYVKTNSDGEKAASQIIKENDYGADKLICQNGRQCFSKFLRNSKIINQDDLTGSCVIIKDTNDETLIRSRLSSFKSYDNLSLDSLYDYIFNDGKPVDVNLYDLNNNYRVDRGDFEILSQSEIDKLSMTGSNTKFYTCANKSFLSGGPINIGGGD